MLYLHSSLLPLVPKNELTFAVCFFSLHVEITDWFENLIHLKYGKHGDGKAVEISGWPAVPKVKRPAEELHAEQREDQYEEKEEEQQ